MMLVLGATGLLGQAVMSEALMRGISCAGAARQGADYTCDISSDDELRELINQTKPNVVINAAAVTDFEQCEREPAFAWAVNARAVSILANCCREKGIKLVQISTDAYFNGDKDKKHTETSPVILLSDYARQKYAGECFTSTADDSLVLRTNIVGLRGWETPTFAEWAISLIRDDGYATLFSDYFVSSIDVESFARSLFDMLEKDATGVVNLASSEVFSKAQFVKCLASVMGKSLTNVTEGSVASLPVKRADSLGLDTTKGERILGYKLPSLAEVCGSISKAYEKKHGI